MSKPFDATLKQLIRHHPADWLGVIGVMLTQTRTFLAGRLPAR